MKIDETTLKDLEIFSPSENNRTIFSIFDKTKTKSGKIKLKRRLESSELTLEDILKTQDIFKYFQNILNKIKFKSDESNIKIIEEYMSSNIIPVYFSSKLIMGFEGLLYKVNYPDYFVFFNKGVFEVIVFLKEIYGFYEIIKNYDVPEFLIKLFQNIEMNLNDPIIKRLLKVDQYNLSYIDIFFFDKIIRENISRNIRELIDNYGEVDSLISISLTSLEYNLNFPEFINNDNSYFEVEDIYHLFVKKAKTNNFLFDDKINLLFLTGPNMAGKTTFLKACGVSLYLAHLGLPVPAKRLKTSYFDSIFTSLNITDNLNKGYSYYYSEVLRVKEAAIKLSNKEKVFIIFDELFKGTNVEEAYSGSEFVIKGFSKYKNCFFIISSHLVELEKELKLLDNITFYYFEAKITNKDFIYDYKLKKGLSKQKLGLSILEKEGIFDLLNS